MQVLTLRYAAPSGWSTPLPTDWDGPATLVLAFCAPDLIDQPQVFDDLAAAFPRSVLAGCSTSGEIAGSQVHDASISLAVVRFDHTVLRSAATPVAGAVDSYSAGVRLGGQLVAPEGGQRLRAVFLLSDGLNVNGTPLVAGLSSVLPPGTAITGGLAGDGAAFRRTWVLAGGQARPQHICAIGLYGERLRMGHGCDAGWSDFGPQRRITRCEGNVLHELDGKPALDLYKSYLGERARELPGSALLFPLAVRRHEGDTEPLVRTILAVDDVQRTMTFAGDLPQGGLAQLMRANSDKLIDSAGTAARQSAGTLAGDQPALVISVSCVGRRLVLGERTDEEVETVLEGSPAQAGHVGFYSYGEISPAVAGGASELHNQTMTVTMFSEA
ncbi:MAG: FIST signal transduction protein [Aquabacterium sp.]